MKHQICIFLMKEKWGKRIKLLTNLTIVSVYIVIHILCIVLWAFHSIAQFPLGSKFFGGKVNIKIDSSSSKVLWIHMPNKNLSLFFGILED